MDTKDPQQVDRSFEAAERIWLQRGQAADPSECTLSHVGTDGNGVEYIKAELAQVAEKTLRDAILDALDNGDPKRPLSDGTNMTWDLFECDYGMDYAVGEDEANAQRLDFATAVVARVRAIVEFDAKERGES